MLTSLFENNKELKLYIYILAEHLSDKSRNEFASLARNYNKKIEIITVNNDTLKDCPIRIGDHVSIATYYRLLAPILLPSEIDKVLYLDCDIIINDNISELYNEDTAEHMVAMCKDEAFFIEEKYERLDYCKSYTYKNAGVALINIKHWILLRQF
jgi:lipopolysaccharide biosynthesis glycosyltransferase